MNIRQDDISPAGFFAFRTPLLPIEELDAWNADLELPETEDSAKAQTWQSAAEADRERLRGRLRQLVERPEIREALFVASPSLVDGLDVWSAKPDSKKGKRAEQALVRYLQRMMTRATPFGLFSGCSLGTLGDATRLRLGPRGAYQRHTRLDMDYLFALSEDLGGDSALSLHLVYRPNSSLYLAAGRWRYAEARLRGRIRAHHLVAVETSVYLEHVLELARKGATVDALVRALVDFDPDGEVTSEEAKDFVFELIESQMLVSELKPPVTGREAIHDLIDQLGDMPGTGEVRRRLESVRDTLDGLDARGLGRDPENYKEIARSLEELPTRVELPRLFQVDMVKPADQATLGAEVVAEIERGIGVLRRLSGNSEIETLATFRQEFLERYEDGHAVPLVAVLDEEVGVGFDRSRGADASPLLEGLDFPSRAQERSVKWSALPEFLLRKVEQAARQGLREIQIGEEDLRDLETDETAPLPDNFEVMATVAAASEGDFDQGRFSVGLRSASGPSGARLLGRFCHADPELATRVEEMFREEEQHDAEAVYAEVVHLPEGRIGNILARPVMREWEIPYLGRGGCDEAHQIPVSDLLVTVVGQRIVLRSKRLGRRVIPRLTSAHNFSARSLGVYRFLCTLQNQGSQGSLFWNWGVLETLAFLPRVTCGRLVLSRARWKVAKSELGDFLKNDDAERFRAVRSWRRERHIPRRAALVDADNELLVDFDNVLSLESFLAVVKGRSELTLKEIFPDEGEMPASGPEGRYVCELVVPFLRRREPTPTPAQRVAAGVPRAPALRRHFPPGSDWLYVKLYTGSSTADRLLAELVGPLAHEAMAAGTADHWFFIRYGDPQWHLRLRFHGDPRRLNGELLPRLQAAMGPLLDDGRVWRFQLDTYRREVERYGGPGGIELAERLAWTDSEAVVMILQHLEGDEGAAIRWHLAVRGIDRLILDLGIEGEEKMRLLERMQSSFAQEHGVDTRFKKQLSDRLRGERRALDALLDAPYDEEHPLAPGLAAFERRSAALVPIVAELRARQEAGRLSLPILDLAPSYIHMFSNRIIRSDGRAHEVVLYDFLHRLTLSRVARARKAKKLPASHSGSSA